MKDSKYKSLLNDFDRYYRLTREGQKKYIESLFAYVHKLDSEHIDSDKDLTEENVNHRVRLLKIASLCLGLHQEFLPNLQNEIALLTKYADSMSEATRDLFESIVEKAEKLSGETEN